jgi:hypothetical protein
MSFYPVTPNRDRKFADFVPDGREEVKRLGTRRESTNFIDGCPETRLIITSDGKATRFDLVQSTQLFHHTKNTIYTGEFTTIWTLVRITAWSHMAPKNA